MATKSSSKAPLVNFYTPFSANPTVLSSSRVLLRPFVYTFFFDFHHFFFLLHEEISICFSALCCQYSFKLVKVCNFLCLPQNVGIFTSFTCMPSIYVFMPNEVVILSTISVGSCDLICIFFPVIFLPTALLLAAAA